MKTTIELGDSLLAEAKRVTAEENTTLRALAVRAEHLSKARLHRRAAPFRLWRVTAKGNGAVIAIDTNLLP
jgi:hypothetical protein